MKYNEIDESIKKELKRDWIITNGIGGFCSQSALGCNTRKYHGLLVAPLTPPARRYLILSNTALMISSLAFIEEISKILIL